MKKRFGKLTFDTETGELKEDGLVRTVKHFSRGERCLALHSALGYLGATIDEREKLFAWIADNYKSFY